VFATSAASFAIHHQHCAAATVPPSHTTSNAGDCISNRTKRNRQAMLVAGGVGTELVQQYRGRVVFIIVVPDRPCPTLDVAVVEVKRRGGSGMRRGLAWGGRSSRAEQLKLVAHECKLIAFKFGTLPVYHRTCKQTALFIGCSSDVDTL
jgi:hypothetical protein